MKQHTAGMLRDDVYTTSVGMQQDGHNVQGTPHSGTGLGNGGVNGTREAPHDALDEFQLSLKVQAP